MDYINEEEDEDTDNLDSDDESDKYDFGFHSSNVDDLHPNFQIPQVLCRCYSCRFYSREC